MQTGIYLITCSANGSCYVGSTVKSFRRRFNQHKSSLRANKHCNSRLQNVFNAYGEDTFSFDILEVCEPDCIYEQELFWIEYFRYISADLVNFVLDPVRFTLDKDARDKISKAHTGKKRPYTSDIARANMSIGQKEAMTDERREYLSKINSKKEYNLVSPDGVDYIGIKGLNRFAKERGLDHSTLYALVNGKIFQYRGWRLLENKGKPTPPQRTSPDRGKNISLAKQKKKKMIEEA